MPDPRAHGWIPHEDADDFTALVGPLFTRGGEADGEYGFVAQRKHLSRFGRLHGAMVLWLADKSMGLTAWHAAGRPAQHATVQLDTQFVQTVQEGEFVQAKCEVVRVTRSLVFMGGRLCSGDRIVASATGVWKYR